MIKSKRFYSGPTSSKFWSRVNAAESRDGIEGSGIYVLGCTLQDLELRILQLLERSEKKFLKLAQAKKKNLQRDRSYF